MQNVKNDILTAGLRKQESIIADFRQRINDVMLGEGSSRKEDYDNFHQTFSPESLAEVNILNNEVEFANHELEEMKRIDCNHFHNQAEYGSIVKTDRKTFFVAASLEDFDAGGRQYFGISVNSPIYFAMKGKKAGEHFKTRNVEYVIEEIY
ncbi:MAG TPA: hypothetical protein VFE50_08865 [Cyclobacteriaceae bacterium]|nr:hypothetical protein [Cyclobacteriaceae bacterium]